MSLQSCCSGLFKRGTNLLGQALLHMGLQSDKSDSRPPIRPSGKHLAVAHFECVPILELHLHNKITVITEVNGLPCTRRACVSGLIDTAMPPFTSLGTARETNPPSLTATYLMNTCVRELNLQSNAIMGQTVSQGRNRSVSRDPDRGAPDQF